MQLQHPPLQDPRTCGASGQKGTEAREPQALTCAAQLQGLHMD